MLGSGLKFASDNQLNRLEGNARHWIALDEREYFTPDEIKRRRKVYRRTLLRVLLEKERRKHS